MLRSPQESNAEHDLRTLLGHVTSHQDPQGHQQQMQHQGQHNIDPAIAGHQTMGNNPADGTAKDGSVDQKRVGGKRELSTTKRAAQNRAAQRAFRQRKETHIRKLEEQVRDYAALSETFKRLQTENYQLRDYIISLQSRLIESQGDFPPAPSNIDLHAPRPDPSQPQPPLHPGNTPPYEVSPRKAKTPPSSDPNELGAGKIAPKTPQTASSGASMSAEQYVPDAVAAANAYKAAQQQRMMPMQDVKSAELPLSERTDPALTKAR